MVVALPNHLHEEAVTAAARAGKAVLCTKPLGRTADEALRMLRVVEEAGVFHGYLEDLVYTPKTLKALQAVRGGSIAMCFGCVLAKHIQARIAIGSGIEELSGGRRGNRSWLPLYRDRSQLYRQRHPACRGDVLGRHASAPDRRGRSRHRPGEV